MDNKKPYVIVQNFNNDIISVIPQTWLISTNIPSIGEVCEWHWPLESPILKSEHYVNVENDWTKRVGRVLNFAGNYLLFYISYINIIINMKYFILFCFNRFLYKGQIHSNCRPIKTIQICHCRVS